MNETVGQVILWVALGLSWLSILLGLPGTVLMLVAAAIYGWATGFGEITGRTLAWLAAIALPVEVLDQLLGLWAARRYGATWIGMAGAFFGAMAGAALLNGVLPLIGVVPGALLGSFAGAYAAEYATRRDSPAALRAAWGGFLGKIAGIALKMSAGLLMAWFVYRALR
jgi:uncharacterized protein YqgC (DUF456 family)